MRTWITGVLFVFYTGSFLSAASISGTEITYAGKQIAFCILGDPITGSDSVLNTINADSNGFFKISLDVKEATEVYSYMGVYRLALFVEPDKDYKVILPAFKPKSKSDNYNPYFEPVRIHLTTQNSDENQLNVRIRMFNDAYTPYYNKHVYKIFTENDFQQLDKDIEQMEKPFVRSKNEYFNNYRQYKYALLRFLAWQQKAKAISNEFLKGKPFLYNNPAYIELFNMVYTNYFHYFSRADSEKKLANSLSSSKSYQTVRDVLAADNVIVPDELLNMVILKGLFEEFYDDNYSRNSLLDILDSFIEEVTDKKQVAIALKIRGRVTKLLTGFAPPAFELYDGDSNLVSLQNFRGKYVYLNFCTCFSYTCLNEFVMLQNLKNKHGIYLEIVTIIVDEDVNVMKDFVTRSGYNWIFLHFDHQPEIIREYDIRAFPTYFLIDREGFLVMSPATSPADEFEARLFKELRAKGIL